VRLAFITHLGLSFERLLSRHHLVQHRAEGEDVGARVGVFAFDLFRRQVLQRADDGSLAGESRCYSWCGIES